MNRVFTRGDPSNLVIVLKDQDGEDEVDDDEGDDDGDGQDDQDGDNDENLPAPW